MYWILDRLRDGTPNQTLGNLAVWDGLKKVMDCATLELKDMGNRRNISRVPATPSGKPYRVKKRWSEKYEWHFHVTGVPGRSLILVHVLNYVHQTRGCIGVGYDFRLINADIELDLFMSGDTLKRLFAYMPEEFDMYINDNGN